MLADGRPSESSVLLSCGQPKKILVLLPLVIHPLIRQTFKAVFEWPTWRFWQALRPADSLWCLPLWRRRPPHLLGFGPWPRRVEPRPTVSGVDRGPLLVNCFFLSWGQLCTKCLPLPQPQHPGACLPTTAVSDLMSRSAVDCWCRCLISANRSRVKHVVKLVSSMAARSGSMYSQLGR